MGMFAHAVPSGGQRSPGHQVVVPAVTACTWGETRMGRPACAPRLTLRVAPDSPDSPDSTDSPDSPDSAIAMTVPLSFFSPASLLHATLPGKLRQSRAAGKAGAGVRTWPVGTRAPGA